MVGLRGFVGMNHKSFSEVDRCDCVCANGFGFTAIRVDEAQAPSREAASALVERLNKEMEETFILGVEHRERGWRFYYPEVATPFPREVLATDWDRLAWTRQALQES